LRANCDRPAFASVQAPYIESFNARLRDELLNGEIFHSLGSLHHRLVARSLHAATPTQ